MPIELSNNGLQPPDKYDNGYEKIEEMLAFVKKNYKPADLFLYGDLEAWALENGFTINENIANAK